MRSLLPLMITTTAALLAHVAAGPAVPTLTDGAALAWPKPVVQVVRINTGKIPRIRIKKRVQNWNRVVVTTTTEGTVVDEVQVNLESLDDGSTQTATTATPASVSVVTSAAFGAILTDKDSTATVRITPVGESGEALGEPIDVSLAASIDEPGEADFDFAHGTGSLSLYDATLSDPDADGKTAIAEVLLDFDDATDDDLSYVKMEIIKADFEVIDSSAELEIDAAEAVWKIDLDEGLDTGRYQVAVFTIEDDEVISGAAALRTVGDDDQAGPVQWAKLTETSREGRYAVSAWSVLTDGSTGATPSMTIIDSDFNEIAAKSMSVKESMSMWQLDGLTFGDDPTDFTYAITVLPYDAEGNPIGSGQSLDVVATAEGLDIVESTEDVDGVGLHKVFMSIDGEQATLALSLDGDGAGEVSRVELTFEEPFEGPEPDELIAEMAHSATWLRTRATFDHDEATLFGVQLNLTSDLGTDETVEFWATAGVSGFGKGTKKSTTSTSSALPQLQ